MVKEVKLSIAFLDSNASLTFTCQVSLTGILGNKKLDLYIEACLHSSPKFPPICIHNTHIIYNRIIYLYIMICYCD